MDDDARLDALRAGCARELHWHGDRTPADLLAEIDGPITPDRYGSGGVVTELEREVAELLGKPDAVFMPSGTMAQQAALRIHADRTGRRTVLLHSKAHPNLHEDQALQRLHDLMLRPVGADNQLLDLDDLQAVAERPGILFLELPQREIGGRLPTWHDLVAQCDWARDRGAALHLDGARLWECGPYFDRPYADIVSPFDSVYVSFYKGLGAVAGACLAGDADLVAEAREWRHRLGGTAFALWPYAASCLAALRRRLPRMPDYVAHAAAIAEALHDVEGIELAFARPRTTMMHLWLRTTESAFRARAIQLAAVEGTWAHPRSWPDERDGWRRLELTVGDATMELTPEEVAAVYTHLVAPLPTGDPGAELVEVVDNDGAVVDVVPRKRMRAEGLRHRATYVVVLTPDNEIVVHKRADWKDVAPGAWDLAFGGVCDVGEEWEAAAIRELAEEAGLTGVPLEPLGPVTWSDGDASLVGRAYFVRWDGELHPADGEVVALDRVPLADLPEWVADHEVIGDTRDLIPPLLENLVRPQ